MKYPAALSPFPLFLLATSTVSAQQPSESPAENTPPAEASPAPDSAAAEPVAKEDGASTEETSEGEEPDAESESAEQPEGEFGDSDYQGVYIDSISGSVGYSYAAQDLTAVSGGVPGVERSEEHGIAFNIGVFAATPKFPELKVFLDFNRRNYSDRNSTQIGLGARYDIVLSTSFQFYLGLEASYNFLHWEQPPAPGIATGIGGAESFGATALAGLDWFFLENLGLTVGARTDFYGLNTAVAQGGATSTLNDYLGVSVLGGLVIRFDRPPRTGRVIGEVAECNCDCGAEPAPEPAGYGSDRDLDGVPDGVDNCPDTLIGVLVGEDGCPLDEFSFDLEFEYAQFTLHKIMNRPTFRVIAFLEKHPTYHVDITGHTDDRGTPGYNEQLALQRAWEAKQFLIDHGIDYSRVRTEGRSDEEPVHGNETSQQRAQNRRIHLRFFNSETHESELSLGDDGGEFDVPVVDESGEPVAPADGDAGDDGGKQ